MHTFYTAVEAGEFLLGFGEADLESLDFAEPAVHPCFGGPVSEVANNLNEARSLLRGNPQHWTSCAGVFMWAHGSVRAAAVTEFHLAKLKVRLEIFPLFFGGLTVFLGWAGRSPLVEKRPVGADQVFLEHGHICFRSGHALVAK
jgi:hypothetical protein